MRELGLSQRDLARAMALTEAWVSNILSRRRGLAPKWVPALQRALRLDPDGARFFAALVDLDGGSARAKQDAAAAVAGIRRQRASLENLREEALLAASSWYVGALIELARCEAFRPDPEWIARTLFPPITPAQADEALTTLIRLGVLAHAPDGRVRVATTEVWFPSNVEHELARRTAIAQRARLEHASLSLGRHLQNERRVVGITAAVSERGNDRILARLVELEREIAGLAMADPDPPNRVYYLGMQWFPVSEFTDWGHEMSTSADGPPPGVDSTGSGA